MYLSTIAEATTFKNLASILHAKALAIKVLPVPGGPYMRQPDMRNGNTFWWFNADSFEEFRVGEGQFDGLSEDSKLVSKTSDI